MITLKLSAFNKKECEGLERILDNVSHNLQANCTTAPCDCANCDVRHLCNSVNNALYYVRGYNSTRWQDKG